MFPAPENVALDGEPNSGEAPGEPWQPSPWQPAGPVGAGKPPPKNKDPWTDPDPQPGDFDADLATLGPDDVEVYEGNPAARLTIDDAIVASYKQTPQEDLGARWATRESIREEPWDRETT